MQTGASGSQRTARITALKGFGVGAVMAGLIALVAVAAVRETATPTEGGVVNPAYGGQAQRPALTAAEEAYAQALWPIHSLVKQNAVKMTFAGLAYKMGDIKRSGVKDRVAPLRPIFEAALAQANTLQPPASMRELHKDYTGAIELYRNSSVTMIKVADEGRDQHLIEAHEMSDKAAGLTLKVGEALWPGEYKPN